MPRSLVIQVNDGLRARRVHPLGLRRNLCQRPGPESLARLPAVLGRLRRRVALRALQPLSQTSIRNTIAMKNQLRALRAEAGWTQAQLAERLGVSRQAVNALEVEKHDPSLDLAYRISVVFGKPVEGIFENPYRAAE